MPRPESVRIFQYLDDIDSFVVTDTYGDIAETLGLAEWTPVVWIGRLFTMDNDFGEHWFDNWELREEKGLSERYFLVDPERFKDGRDGPYHTAEFRKRFWTDVLKSLELSFALICDEARQFNERNRKWLLEEQPGILEKDFIPDLESRIERLRIKYFV
jgi:hypothetical protein